MPQQNTENTKPKKGSAIAAKLSSARKPVLIAVIAVAAILVILALFGRISTVEVKLMNGSNETHFYSDSRLAEACGVSPGSSSLLKMVFRTRASKVLEQLPLLTDVSTHVSLRKATIYAKFSPRVFITEAGEGGAVMVLNDDLRIVPEAAPAGAAALKGVYFKAGEAGEAAECTDSRMLDRLRQLCQALDELPTSDAKVTLHLTEVDMTNRLRITITHEDRVRIVLGKVVNLKEKLVAARELVDQREKKDPGGSYIIYATGSSWYYMSEVYSVSGDFVPNVEGNVIDGVVEGMDSLDAYDEAYGGEEWYDGAPEEDEEEPDEDSGDDAEADAPEDEEAYDEDSGGDEEVYDEGEDDVDSDEDA